MMLCEADMTRFCACMSPMDVLHLFDLGQRSELKAEWRRWTRGTSKDKFDDVSYIPFLSPLRPAASEWYYSGGSAGIAG